MQRSQEQNKVKKSGCYFLIKDQKIELSQFCTLYPSGNKNTEQYKHTKVFDSQKIKKYQLDNCLQYNQEVLLNCPQMDYIVHLDEAFIKKGNIYMIHEYFQNTLVETVHESSPCTDLVETVLTDVLSGLIEIYKIEYATRSLRPQHIVYANGKWKIQSFVLNQKVYEIESEFCWSRKFASPEDRAKTGELAQQKVDEQLVWNLGIIGLYMLLGPNFQYSNINNDNFIPWHQIKQLTSQNLYDFLTAALKVNFSQRLRLKDLFQHKIFGNKFQSQSSQSFLSYEKFFGSDSQKKKIFESGSNEELKTIQSLKNCIQHALYYGQVEKYVHQIHFKSIFDSSLIRYLSFKISHDMLQEIKNSIVKQRRKNKLLKQLQKKLNNLSEAFKQKKLKYLQTLRDSKAATSQILEIQNLLQNHNVCDESIWDSKAIKIFISMVGSIYSEIANCREMLSQSKQRTVCFYSLAVYLLFYYEHDRFKDPKTLEYVKDEVLDLKTFINEGPIGHLIQLTQQLVKDHFLTDEKK